MVMEGNYELHLVGADEEPPEMTLREYIENYFGDEKQYLDGSGLNESDLDKVMDYWDVVNVWAYNDRP